VAHSSELRQQIEDLALQLVVAEPGSAADARGWMYALQRIREQALGEQAADVAAAAVAEAEESLRITQNRYQAGMANVTDLLRTETALLESRTRQLAAVHDERVAAAQLELAAGSLSAYSEVLN